MRGAEGSPDTGSMPIVHAALRRDLERARTELTTHPYPDAAQRRALAEHVGWLMAFLHEHHTSEDAGLWPLVRRRNESAAPLLDSLAADHERIGPSITALTESATSYLRSAGDDARRALVDAIDTLTGVLLPHLDREVAEGMPVVETSITAREWAEWDERYNIKPYSLAELGLIGQWLLDGLDEQGYRLITHLVPPVQRFVLVHGFARSYRRRTRACWRAQVASPLTAAR